MLHVVHFRFSVRQVIEGRWFKRDGKEKPREGEGFVRHDRRVRWLLQLPDGFEIQIDDERSVYVGERRRRGEAVFERSQRRRI